MSNFICEECGTEILDSPIGYTTGCEHHPLDHMLNYERQRMKAGMRDDYLEELAKEQEENTR